MVDRVMFVYLRPSMYTSITRTTSAAPPQSLSSLGENGHTLCRRIKLSNKSLSEEAARVVAEALRTMEQVSVLVWVGLFD